MSRILVTGSAGFIGSALTLRLLKRGDSVVGIDNHNEYYSPSLKESRLARHIDHPDYEHIRGDLSDKELVANLFETFKPVKVVNLAAQPGVRYSITNPHAYIASNIVGFMNVLEGCRRHHIKHLVFSSSSSVYGANETVPFSEHDNVDHPVSLYAATKKSNELMAHAYAHLYGIPCTGLRYFTVYGPWGRPDMAPMLFAKAILEGSPIDVYNQGNMSRDFTYLDDIVDGTIRALDNEVSPNPEWDGKQPDPASSYAPWRVYNIGNSKPVKLMDFISALERALGVEAKKNFLPMQDGDVPATFADIEDIKRDVGYKPEISVDEGVARFVDWYRTYYKC